MSISLKGDSMFTQYVSIATAVQELHERQRDSVLIKSVGALIGGWEHCPFPVGTNGFFCQHVANIHYVDVVFSALCLRHGLMPVWGEYLDDLFTVRNGSKNRLTRLHVRDDDATGGKKSFVLIGNPVRWERHPLHALQTDDGRNLVAVYHELHDALFPQGIRRDMSLWLKRRGPRAQQYYPQYFAIMTVAGILFEDFDETDAPSVAQFNRDVVEPAWERVVREWGLPPPLIVRHPVYDDAFEEMIQLDMCPSFMSDAVHQVFS